MLNETIYLALIKPRLTDFYGIHLPQEQVDFAIPFFDEDLPLYLDPFLLWKSPSMQDKALHGAILNCFNHIGYLAKSGNEDEAIKQLVIASECDEVGLGVSAKRSGKRISYQQAIDIAGLFSSIPEYSQNGFRHFEEIQFFIDGISKDRISDFGCNLLKSFLIDYTIDQCVSLGISLSDFKIPAVFDLNSYSFKEEDSVKLPQNPQTGQPIILVPKRWLRFIPWINFDDYYKSSCPMDKIFKPGEAPDRVKILNYNRHNYGVVSAYVKEKEKTFNDCLNDPLFKAIPVTSAKRKLAQLKKLPTGKDNNADKEYEDIICQLLASLLYPHLDFAAEQSRTDSGVNIRDLIFYNNRSHQFLKELFDDYGSKQVVFEIKNVKAIEREHINQLNRYMTDELGKFGVLVTRNLLPAPRRKNTIDLWSGHRRCIISLTDADIEQMVELFESRQRLPLDVIKKKYVEFRRFCPS